MRFNIKKLSGLPIVFGRTIVLAAICCAFAAMVRAAPVDVTAPPFYADKTNSTDSRAAIQAAINSLGPTGGTVYFPPGLYRVDSTIYVPRNIRLQSMGSTVYNTQIRLTATQMSLFEVRSGASNVVFKDLTLFAASRPQVWPRYTAEETAFIRAEGTTGIALPAQPGRGAISNIVVENVRISQFTYGIAATAPEIGTEVNVTGVKIRNYASDGNEYSLHTNTKGADDWDVQNMNVYPTYDKQNGIFLERSGRMRFLQLSCAGAGGGYCVKLWDNGDTYFREMHSEGPRPVCIGSDCAAPTPSFAGANSSVVTFENSAVGGDVYRATNLVTINNRYWLDYPQPPAPAPPSFTFHGTSSGSPGPGSLYTGFNSSLKSCGNVWVSWDPATHMSNTTVTTPSSAYPGLATALQGCERGALLAVPPFDTGYEADVRVPHKPLNGEEDVVTDHGATSGGGDDTTEFQNAINAARQTRGKRVFVPSGTYHISSTLDLQEGESVIGEAGSTIILTASGKSLFRILNRVGTPVKAVSIRNLALDSVYNTGTIGINFENVSAASNQVGSASDFQIQNMTFNNFENGIAVRPVGGTLSNPNPMFDSASVKGCNFTNNKIAVLIRSSNASHWNLEKLDVNIPGSDEGVRIDNGGHVSVRQLDCTGSGTGLACVTIQRQSGAAIEGVTATGVLNALFVPWENGWAQFPVTLRNNYFEAGVYFQGRIFLSSINNTYPAKLKGSSTARSVIFGAYQEGDPLNVAPGEMSDVFSCDDQFKDPAVGLPQNTWTYLGTLAKAVTYCY